MSSRNGVYEEQCERWHNELLIEFERNNTSNLKERLDEIENVVNDECNKYSLRPNGFKIGLKQRHNLLSLYNKDLREHTAVSHGKCAAPIKNVNEYKQKARNKLNRWKPKVIGHHILYEIIFVNIYNYCYEIGKAYNCQWDDTYIKNLFVTIFCKLLEKKIRFKKTRDVPLILSTVFSTNTRFKRSCVYFLEHFNDSISWNTKAGKKAADKASSFKKCLHKILQYTQIAIPPPIIIGQMDITENNRRCDVYYIHIIKQNIIALEREEYMNYYERISNHSCCAKIVAIINDYFCGAMSFWSVTPHKPVTHTYNNYNFNFNLNDDDIDGDIRIESFNNTYNNNNTNNNNNNNNSTCNNTYLNVPPEIHHNISNISYNSDVPLMITNKSYNSHCSDFSSLSRGTSTGSSIPETEQLPNLPNLPQLNDGNNLFPLISGEEINCPQMSGVLQQFHSNHSNHNINIVHEMDVEPVSVHYQSNSNLYGNSQQINMGNNNNNITQTTQQISYNNNSNNNNNNNNMTPHITQQLPPPPIHAIHNNYSNYQPTNPHISQQLPPPPTQPMNYTNINNNMFNVNNIPPNYNQSQPQPQPQPQVHVNNYVVNNNNNNNNCTVNNTTFTVNNTPHNPFAFIPRDNMNINNNNNNNFDGYTMIDERANENETQIMQYEHRNAYDNISQYPSNQTIANYDHSNQIHQMDQMNQTVHYEYSNQSNPMQMELVDSVPMVYTNNQIDINNQPQQPQMQPINTINYNYCPEQMNYN